MTNIVMKLEEKGLINPPRWLSHNVMYSTIMGSVAYGVSADTSDMDIYGFCIPIKEMIFPHLGGYIIGFGKSPEIFEQYQQHHIIDPQAMSGNGRSYDLSIYNIVKYFQLCMENNPNMVDSLFTPVNCVLHSTKIGNMVRENRKIFLHKGSYQKFLGYAHSQLHKAGSKEFTEKAKLARTFEDEHNIPHTITAENVEKEFNVRGSIPELHHLSQKHLLKYRQMMQSNNKRFQNAKEMGCETKFLYHLVRLSDECEQILTLGDLDLQRAKEHMKAVRRGEISEKEIRDWFSIREKTLEKLYAESTLQYSPNEVEIKALLLNCLEEHYGNLEKCVVKPDQAIEALKEVQSVLDKNRSLFG